MSELAYLLQKDIRKDIETQYSKSSRIVINNSFYNEKEHGGIYCALISNDKVSECLERDSWELTGDAVPGCTIYHEEGEDKIEYQRFNCFPDVEPFIIRRDFYGLKPDYVELLEEFRLFHNLYYDEKKRVYIKLDEAGNEQEIVRILENNTVEILRYPVRQFLAMKDACLVVYFDIVRNSKLPISDVPEDELTKMEKADDFVYRIDVVEPRLFASDEWNSFSRVLGKFVIRGLPREKSGIWPFEVIDENYQEFIISVDENDKIVSSTCEPSRLDNYFGANPEAPSYLTPVFFKPEVLSKYYESPEKYSVEDGYLRCSGLWGMRIDNDSNDYVIVFLGDLGRDLPKSEHEYWKHFNIPPDGKLSPTAFKRGILGVPTDPNKPDLVFKYKLSSFQINWEKMFGWSLFKPLHQEDKYLLSTLRVPLTDSQSEFESQLLSIAKILVDSLNEKEITKEIGELPPDTKGISKFEEFLNVKSYPQLQRDEVITLLRNIQALRSTGAAHRKGSNYEKTLQKLNLKDKSRQEVIENILEESGSFLEKLGEHFFE